MAEPIEHIEKELLDLRDITREHGEQIIDLKSSVEATSRDVSRIVRLVERIDERVDNIEKPDVSMWVKVLGVVTVVSGSLWGLAIAPVNGELQNVQSDISTISAKLDVVQSTRHTAADDSVIMAAERRIREQSDAHTRELLEMEISHSREVVELRISAIEHEVDAHIGDSDHPGGVRREIEQLRSEVLSRDLEALKDN